MSTYPAITAAIADQRRQDLIAQAEAYRLARAARQATPYTSGRLAGARQGRTARPSRPGRGREHLRPPFRVARRALPRPPSPLVGRACPALRPVGRTGRARPHLSL